jgi:hypothetical protein
MPSQPAAPATLPHAPADAAIPATPVPTDRRGVRRAVGRVITTLFTRVSEWLCELKPDELWLTLIVGAAYTLSYERLWQFALHQLHMPQELAWLFPLAVDGITIYVAYDAGRALRERKLVRVVWAWILTLGFTAASMWFQYLGGVTADGADGAAAQPTAAATESWSLRLARAFLPIALLAAIEIRNSARAARAAGAPTFWQLWRLRALQRAANGTPTRKQIRAFRVAVRTSWHQERIAAIKAGQLPGAQELAALTDDIAAHTVTLRRPPARQPATTKPAVAELAGGTPPEGASTTPRHDTGQRRAAAASTTTRRGRRTSPSTRQNPSRVGERRDVVARLYTANRGITDTVLMAKVGEELGQKVSLRTVQRDLENLWRQGRIPRRLRSVS